MQKTRASSVGDKMKTNVPSRPIHAVVASTLPSHHAYPRQSGYLDYAPGRCAEQAKTTLNL